MVLKVSKDRSEASTQLLTNPSNNDYWAALALALELVVALVLVPVLVLVLVLAPVLVLVPARLGWNGVAFLSPAVCKLRCAEL